MSFSLAITPDGDLDVQGSAFRVVYGPEKLSQDLSIWLKERFQSDRFHPSYGSILDSFVGSVMTRSTQVQVQNEVMRVLQNYQRLQYRLAQQAPHLLAASEILYQVLDINTVTNYDTVGVNVRIQTGNQQTTTVNVAATV